MGALLVALGSCHRDPLKKRSPEDVQTHETRPPAQIVTDIRTAAGMVDGPVGIAVRSMDEGWEASTGCDRRLPQQSVSKLWVAIALMDQIDKGRSALADPVTVLPSDLTLFHQPIAAYVGSGGFQTTVLDLLLRAMTQSDNSANDRLLTLVGGPEAVRRMLEKADIADVTFGPGERRLQSDTAGLYWQQPYSIGNAFKRARSSLSPATRLAAYRRYVAAPPDGATACGIVEGLKRLKEGSLLTRGSSQTLLSVMTASTTGFARLRSGLSAGWQIAHKTGTGQSYGGRTAGFNDVGILTAPDGSAYAVAVLIGDSSYGERRMQETIRAVAQAVVRHHDRTHPMERTPGIEDDMGKTE